LSTGIHKTFGIKEKKNWRKPSKYKVKKHSGKVFGDINVMIKKREQIALNLRIQALKRQENKIR